MTFDEADVLRAAARVRNVLADYDWHRWRESIDACRLLAGGRWGDACALAYATLGYFADVEWDGPKGRRVVRLRPAEADVYAEACPRCGARAGWLCLRLNTSTPTPKAHPHEERAAVAVVRLTYEPDDLDREFDNRVFRDVDLADRSNGA